MIRKIVVVILVLLIFISANHIYARDKSLTKDVVKKAIAENAVRAKFCKLNVDEKVTNTFAEALSSGYGTADPQENDYIKFLSALDCDKNEYKEIIYGTLRMVFIDTEKREDLLDGIFLIDDELIVPDGSRNVFYSPMPEEINLNSGKELYGVTKGIKTVSRTLREPYDKDLSVKNAPTPNFNSPVDTGYYVTVDPDGKVEDIYVLYKGNLYKFVEKIKQIENIILVDYTQNDSSVTPIPSLTNEPTIDPTANWKTYTNPLGKYSLSYPPDSLIQVSEARNQKVTQDTGFFRRITGNYVYGADTPVSFDISLNTEPPSDLTEDAHCNRITKSKTSINSVPADKIISEYGISPDCYNGSIAPPFSKIVYITFIHNNSMFKIRYGLEYFGGGIKEEVFAQMLSTFKFTDSNATPIPTCMPRPACLDATPRCMIAEPASGWCSKN